MALLNVWKADVLLRPVLQASPASASSFGGSIVMKTWDMETVVKHKGWRASLTLLNV